VGHPELENTTPFAFEALYTNDEDGRPVVAPLVKATFDIGVGGVLGLAEEQVAIRFTEESHGEPGSSSPRFEPESAFTKPATDVVLIGHAHALRRGTVQSEVSVRVGPVAKTVRVTGDRHWTRRFLGIAATRPEPFEKIPLTYERSYGGWDRSHPDPERHSFHPANPVGVGFRARRTRWEEGARLPNVEDPAAVLRRYRGKSRPAGFGFTAPHWEPRRLFAGTYDASWERDRMPLLPKDFDRRFFNAAAPGLVAPGYLRGDEAVLVRGASADGTVSFRLPGIHPPAILLSFRDRLDETLRTKLDTVIVDLDERKLLLTWRAFTALDDGPLDVRSIAVHAENAPTPQASQQPSNVLNLPSRNAA